MCGDCQDFKVITNLQPSAFRIWEQRKFFPEEKFLAGLRLIKGVSNVGSRTHKVEVEVLGDSKASAKPSLSLPGLKDIRADPSRRQWSRSGSALLDWKRDGSPRFAKVSTDASTVYGWSAWVSWCHWLVNHRHYEHVMAVIIFVQSGYTGFEAQAMVDRDLRSHFSQILNMKHFFTAIFLIDTAMMLSAYGWNFLSPRTGSGLFNILDTFLAIVGIFTSWVIPYCGITDEGVLRASAVCRSLRTLRLLRVVRKVKALTQLKILFLGLWDAMGIVLKTVCAIVCVTYVFAVLGTVSISTQLVHMKERAEKNGGKVSPEVQAMLDTIRGVDMWMFTLIQVLTTDSWISTFARPLERLVPFSWILLFSFVALMVLALMNLFTALILEHTTEVMQASKQDLEEERVKKVAAEQERLHELFNMMDSDGNGFLSKEEFQEAFSHAIIRRKWQEMGFRTEEWQELFKLLDMGSGEVSISDFCDGLTKMQGPALAKDVFAMIKAGHHMATTLAELTKSVEEMKTLVAPSPKRRGSSRFTMGF